MAHLAGKVALVTGGSRGIGRAIAKRLAADGADVALTYVSSADKAHQVADEIRANGRRALAIEADSADPRAVAAAVERTVAELGRLDILVNNAGIFTHGPFETVTLDELDRMLSIHVRSVFVASQAASPHLGAGGRIISIGSNLAERVAAPGVTLYAMTKSALLGFTRGLARELGPRGITVNLIQPGSTDTDMNPIDGPGAGHQLGLRALAGFNDARDVAATVAYLAGEDGRAVSGSVITIDGAQNA